MQRHNVPRSTAKTNALSFGWLDDVPEGEDFAGSHGRVFDVIVMSRPGPNERAFVFAVDRGTMCLCMKDSKIRRVCFSNESFVHNRSIYSALFESGRPILLAPPAPPVQIASNVLIAWDRSTEQARNCAGDAASSKSEPHYSPDSHWWN